MFNHYRVAAHQDVQSLVELVNHAYRPADKAGWTHEADLIAGNRTNPQRISDLMAKPESVVLVGQIGSELVACVHVEKFGTDSQIGMLAIAQRVQKAGLGAVMIECAENYAATCFGSVNCFMWVMCVRTELIAYYKRRGYARSGDTRDYPSSLGAGVPLLSGQKIERLEKQISNNAITFGSRHAIRADYP